jgi:hypothetical protein
VWHKRRPVPSTYPDLNTEAFAVDTSKIRIVSLSRLYLDGNTIPHRYYLYGDHYPALKGTLFAALEVDGDPYGLLIPTIELIRFYYTPSTRLAQAFFWGDYERSINLDKSGLLGDGLYRVHLRKHIHDSDAWTLARFHASRVMQEQVRRVYRDLQAHRIKSLAVDADPFGSFRCGFPFEGTTSLCAVTVRLPGATSSSPRALALKLLKCSGPFPFSDLVCDRDNRNFKGKLRAEEELAPAWRRSLEFEDRSNVEPANPEEAENTLLNSEGEPFKGYPPLIIDLQENRFEDLEGKRLIKEPTEVQRYRNEVPMIVQGPALEGLGTGEGVWGGATNKAAEIVVTNPNERPRVPATLDTFFRAIALLAEDPSLSVRFVAEIDIDLVLSVDTATLGFPTSRPAGRLKAIRWARIPVEGGFRARQVAVVEVISNRKVAYVLECERVREKDNISVLIIRRNDFAPMTGDELRSFLLVSAARGRWVSESEHKDFRRERTTHNRLTSVTALSKRIGARLRKLYGPVTALPTRSVEEVVKAPNTRVPDSEVTT